MTPPSLDKALSFEPYNGHPDHIMWDLECKDLSGQMAFHLAVAWGWDSVLQPLFDNEARLFCWKGGKSFFDDYKCPELHYYYQQLTSPALHSILRAESYVRLSCNNK